MRFPISIPDLGTDLQEGGAYLKRVPGEPCLLDSSTRGHFLYLPHDSRVVLESQGAGCVEAGDGELELCTKDESSPSIYVRCVEESVLPTVLPIVRRYVWSFSLLGEKLHSAEQSHLRETGAYLDLVDDYYETILHRERKEQYAPKEIPENFHHIVQYDYNVHSLVVGRILRLTETFYKGQLALIADIPLCLNNTEIILKVLLPQEIMGVYHPAVGEELCCEGILHAVPHELLNDGDRPWGYPLGRAEWEERNQEGRIPQELSGWEIYSLALEHFLPDLYGCGWELVSMKTDSVSRCDTPIIMKDYFGEYYAILIDTRIEGKKPEFSYEERIPQSREAMRKIYGKHGHVCHCIFDIHVSYSDSERCRYRTREKVDPRPNFFDYTGSASCDPAMHLQWEVDAKGTANYKFCEQSVFCEQVAVVLAREALVQANWLIIAQYIHEEAVYYDDNNSMSLVGKINFLRYLSEWADSLSATGEWQNLAASSGYLVSDGTRRCVTALHKQGEVIALVSFAKGVERIGAIHSLSSHLFPSYVRTSDVMRLSNFPAP